VLPVASKSSWPTSAKGSELFKSIHGNVN